MIDRIGIELEGGWEDYPPDWKGKVVHIIQDLSIDGRTLPTDKRLEETHVGEVVSPPLSLDEWRGWLSAMYPNGVNITCGLHVHLSFTKKRDYSMIMSKSFERKVLGGAGTLARMKELPKDHYLWARLKGNSPFASFMILPKEQVKVKEKRIGMRARYAAFNHCFSMHGTVEYRVLPMFPEGADLAQEFIENYLSVVEAELERTEKQVLSFGCSLREHQGIIQEREVK
jgi:hypothetical protein